MQSQHSQGSKQDSLNRRSPAPHTNLRVKANLHHRPHAADGNHHLVDALYH
ncbi:Uncharacterised protein [Vibrio cholerae]|nr:Uncharacterised protein [Vibrio cholerae]